MEKKFDFHFLGDSDPRDFQFKESRPKRKTRLDHRDFVYKLGVFIIIFTPRTVET